MRSVSGPSLLSPLSRSVHLPSSLPVKTVFVSKDSTGLWFIASSQYGIDWVFSLIEWSTLPFY